jgi:drug/metabolite transporter (DMT)-like permease
LNTTTSSTAASSKTLLIAAFATIYIVWGSTYLAIRVAVETLPPFLLAAMRFTTAGTVMFLWLWARGTPVPDKKQTFHAAIAGVLLLLGGNGLVVWAEQTVSSSLTALLVAVTPVWFVLLDWMRPHGTRPVIHTVLGMMLGFAGVALLVTGHNLSGATLSQNPWGIIALILAGICWASGSLWARYNAKPKSPWMNSALQMTCGGISLAAVSLVRGEPVHFHIQQVSAHSWLALLYLTVFGSLIAFSAYVFLLRASTPARVATYAYVNPMIAVILGKLILEEPFGVRALWASAIILAGVVITTLPKRG